MTPTQEKLLDASATTNPFAGNIKLSIGTDEKRILADTLNKYSGDNPSAFSINNTSVRLTDSIQKKEISEEFNILKDYIWTLSENKNDIISTVPKLIANEYNIATSPLVQNLKASLSIGTDLFAKNVKILGGALGGIVPSAKGLTDVAAPEWASTFIEGVASSDIVKKISDTSKDVWQKVAAATKVEEDDHSWSSSKLKELYDNLYTLKSTGKKFIFPYMDDEFLAISNNFSEGNEYLQFEAGLFNLDTSNARSNLKKFSNLPALLSPGAYIQMPQFYDFASTGSPVITIKFPLYNNVDSYETSKNMKFVKLFGLNNMPYRQNIIAVDPTKIYDIYIPGKANFPLCYVSNYVVDHIGTKSLLGENIYPEAYSVQITFTSLIKYDVNMYLEAMKMETNYTPPPGRKLSPSAPVKTESSKIKEKATMSDKEIMKLPPSAPVESGGGIIDTPVVDHRAVRSGGAILN